MAPPRGTAVDLPMFAFRYFTALFLTWAGAMFTFMALYYSLLIASCNDPAVSFVAAVLTGVNMVIATAWCVMQGYKFVALLMEDC